eukprot:GHUV01034811.1.p1 GENE.GHUV01034811.1~~GHUV01034811.1.p1  ORF type:complete len:293 (-),score=82.20 GHUV01034811.1:24-902(-)
MEAEAEGRCYKPREEPDIQCTFGHQGHTGNSHFCLQPSGPMTVDCRRLCLLLSEGAANCYFIGSVHGLEVHRSVANDPDAPTLILQVSRFTHWLPEKVEYKCSFRNSSKDNAIGGNVISSTGFDAPVSITAPAAGPNGVEVECVVGFEPSAIGEAVRDVLVLSSATAGAYEVPLMGQCVPPKPQGPIDVSKGSASVQFRNVFSVDAEFLYSVDNPAFVLAKTTEKLPAKKPVSISISYKPEAAAKAATERGVSAGREKSEAAAVPPAPSRTGKLTISCPTQTSTQWVFYLQA